MNSTSRLLLLLVLVSFAFEREAKGYTDPGTGALVWQLILSGFVGAMFYARRVLNWTRRRSNRE